ncbi:NUDIX hydrolase [Chlorobium sp. N1]|uniref:NUDIX hydrolase n=1 Tax=Chlorobium sp. N1 TaxID=2491138 RepID=UPI0010400535|nr:NUDIX hydrolase [Chlorobium sp. N1]TCD48523.1 NUDIX hydrolase [Chlorobium sp. N1]
MSRAGDPTAWTTLSTEYLHREPWLTLRRDRVRLQSGRIIEDYYVQEFPPWVNVIAVRKDGKIVLIRQYRHGIGGVFYELPAGVHDREGESLMEAAQRELREETGYGGGRWRRMMELSANPALQDNRSTTFLAEGVELLGSQELDATEEITLAPISPDELLGLIDSGGMVQALHAAPLLRYLIGRKNGTGTNGRPGQEEQ